jgi:hypothetical protein
LTVGVVEDGEADGRFNRLNRNCDEFWFSDEF